MHTLKEHKDIVCRFLQRDGEVIKVFAFVVFVSFCVFFILEAEELLKLHETVMRVYGQRTSKPFWVVSEDMDAMLYYSHTVQSSSHLCGERTPLCTSSENQETAPELPLNYTCVQTDCFSVMLSLLLCCVGFTYGNIYD